MAKTAPPKDELLKSADEAFMRAARKGPSDQELDHADLDGDQHLEPIPPAKPPKKSALKAWAGVARALVEGSSKALRAGKKKR